MFARIILIVLLSVSYIFALSDKELAVTIDLSGKQRMLTQKMSKEALLIKSGINKSDNQKKLKASAALFDKTLKGLEKGDKELQLVPTDNADIQKQLKKVESLWKPFYKEIKKVTAGKADNKSYKIIEKSNLPLLKEMNKAVYMYASLSKNGKGMKLAMANDINLAGKQRMLTQKMAKDLLMIANNIDSKKYSEDFHKSRALFDRTLRGLLNGDKKLKLNGTKLPKIRRQLLIVQNIWKKSQPHLENAIYKQKDIDKAIADLDKLKIEMNKAVILYTKSLNRQKQIFKLSSLVSGFMQNKNQLRRVINLAGKQRMLTQRISKLALQCTFGLNAETSCKSLLKYAALYDKTLNGFVKGDRELGLSPTKNKKALAQISKLKKLWKPFYQAVKRQASSMGKDKKALEYILANNEKLLKESNELVNRFEAGNTSHNYLETARLHIVNIAGRERMLSQKMAKEKLLVLKYHRKQDIQKLHKTMKLFEDSLYALIKGNPEMHIVKPGNKAIKKQLLKVAALWNKLKILYTREKLKPKELNLLIKTSPILLREMNKAVKMSETAREY